MSQDEKPLVRGNHLPSSDDVTEGGKAPSPTDGPGKPKPATSRAEAEGNPTDGTSKATQGKAEKDHAAGTGAGQALRNES
ncbi:hypothetical protein [Sabulicella rubraurantiaca]|uniref:hypothetical protein n=1 Tax=Sabulicella rubraurantiaca TaxID=2811429 RepID=UPI001A96769C|nr:hypothetical protein [Sabulicella rubraurantiaca]